MLDPDALTHHSDEDFENVYTPEQETKPGDEDFAQPTASFNPTPPSYKYLPFDSNDLVTVQAENVLYKISADIFRLCAALPTPIANPLYISGLSASHMTAFLAMIHAKTIRVQSWISPKEWTEVLHAATQLQCREIRAFTIESMDRKIATLQPLRAVRLGLRYRVLHWTAAGFTRLIEQEEPLSYEEGDALGMKRVLAIYRCRESLAKSQKEGDTAEELLDKEPDLKAPEWNVLDGIGFTKPSDALSFLDYLDFSKSSFVDLMTEDTIWKVPMTALAPAPYLQKRIDEQKGLGHQLGCPRIDLGGEVSRGELEAYLWVANARLFQHSSGQSLELNFQQWIGALRLATIFEHTVARRFIIGFIEPQLNDQDPFYVIESAKACNVEHWLKPQYVRIAQRQKFPSEEEGRRLGVGSLIAICQLREESAYKRGEEAGAAMNVQCDTCGSDGSKVKKVVETKDNAVSTSPPYTSWWVPVESRRTKSAAPSGVL